jgi:hypothetical protein
MCGTTLGLLDANVLLLKYKLIYLNEKLNKKYLKILD